MNRRLDPVGEDRSRLGVVLGEVDSDAKRLNLTGYQLDVRLVGTRMAEKYLEIRHDRGLARKLTERQRWPLLRGREEVCAGHRLIVREGCAVGPLDGFECLAIILGILSVSRTSSGAAIPYL